MQPDDSELLRHYAENRSEEAFAILVCQPGLFGRAAPCGQSAQRGGNYPGEEIALKSMDPNASYGDAGQTVQDRLNHLAQQKTAVTQLGEQAGNLMPSLSDEDWIIYKDRWLMFGEANAQQWVVNRYGLK